MFTLRGFLHFLACIAKHVGNLLHVNLIISLQIPCVNGYARILKNLFGPLKYIKRDYLRG